MGAVLRALGSVALFAGLGYYVWRRLVHDTGLRGRAPARLTAGPS